MPIVNEQSRAPDPDGVARYAVALLECGAPTHVVEASIDQLLASAGTSGTAVATPTAVWLQIGEHTRITRARPGGVDLGKLTRLHRWLDVGGGRMGQLPSIIDAPHRWSLQAQRMAFVVGSASAGLLMGSSIADVFAGGLAGLVVHLALVGLPWDSWQPLANIVVGGLSGAVGGLSTLVGAEPFAVALAGVIVVVPGLSLTVAVAELAAGMWTSGSSRLTAAALACAQLAVGLGVGVSMGADLAPWMVFGPMHPAISMVLVLAAAPVAFGILLGCHARDLAPIVVVTSVAFCVQAQVPGVAGAAVAALVVGLSANAVARTRHISALVVSVPGVLLLVPGSLGVRSANLVIHQDLLGALGLAAEALGLAGAIALGLLTAHAMLPGYRPSRGF